MEELAQQDPPLKVTESLFIVVHGRLADVAPLAAPTSSTQPKHQHLCANMETKPQQIVSPNSGQA